MKRQILYGIAAVAILALVLGYRWLGDHAQDDSHGDHRDHGGHGDHGDHGDGDHGHEGGHDHGEGAIGITKFSEKIEIFAEHPPAVTGQELTFLVHLTLLADFSPIEEATVTLVLEGPTKVEASVDQMLRPGIFQPTLVAPKAGRYQAKLVVQGKRVEDTIDGFEIIVHPSTDAAAAAATPEGDSKGAEPISFTKEQQWQVPFGTAFAVKGSVVPTIEVAGEITTPPSGQADVGAAITGRIVAPPDGLPTPGTSVEEGALLATIAPAPAAPEEGARADLAVVEAEARVESARAAVERSERLLADQAVSEREVEDARRELKVAESAVKTAQRARSIFTGAASGRGAGTYRVTSPIDGVVVEVEATEGKSVSGGDLLFRVVHLDELWVKARVPEQQAARIRSDQDGAFEIPGLDTWLPLDVTGEDANAKVVSIGRTVDRRSRTVDIIYGLTGPDERLRVGALVRVAVPAGIPWEKGIVIPRGAVIEDEGRSIVYVQVEGESFEERVVALGPRSGNIVGVEKGLVEGERVVTIGANVIRLTARSSSAPSHGHVH